MQQIVDLGRCIESGTYVLHSEFKKVVNFKRSDQDVDYLVSIVDQDVGKGPFNIVVDKNFLVTKHLVINRKEIDFTSVSEFDPFVDSSNYSSDDFGRTIGGFETELKRHASSLTPLIALLTGSFSSNSLFDKVLCDRFIQASNLVFSDRFLEGIKMMKGVGTGLTPTGDDFICGLLFGMNLISGSCRQSRDKMDRIMSRIYYTAKGENLISNSALFAARHGMFFEKLKDVVIMLDEFDRLLGIGHSSGADIAIGFLVCLKRKEIWLQMEL